MSFRNYSQPNSPGASDGKVSVYSAGDLGSIPGSGRFHGEGKGNPLQYACLENPMGGGVRIPAELGQESQASYSVEK